MCAGLPEQKVHGTKECNNMSEIKIITKMVNEINVELLFVKSCNIRTGTLLSSKML